MRRQTLKCKRCIIGKDLMRKGKYSLSCLLPSVIIHYSTLSSDEGFLMDAAKARLSSDGLIPITWELLCSI